MRKIIYLDVDGVLVPLLPSLKKRRPAVPNETCLENLRRLCITSGAEVVVSSSWRVGKTVEQMAEMFKRWGLFGVNVTGLTPVSKEKNFTREDEITRHTFDLRPGDSFVVLDDEWLKFQSDSYRWRFVRTLGTAGLMSCDVDLALERLEVPMR